MVADSCKSELPVELIVDADAQSGRFNMAIDEALLESGGLRNVCVCRIYRWSEPTVTLGYFQAKQQEQVSPFPDLPVVRRLSGGGAILHDQELTYSCILPPEHPIRHDPSQLYVLIHSRLIELLEECGVKCCLRSEFQSQHATAIPQDTGETQKAEQFLCFLRQNPNDIVDVKTGIKTVGSAQRRRRGVILQHGSILMNASALAPDIKGLKDLNPEFDSERFQDQLPHAIASSIGIPGRLRGYSEHELAVSAQIEQEMRSWANLAESEGTA